MAGTGSGRFIEKATAQGTTPEKLAQKTIEEHGSIERAARVLDVNRNTLRYWLRKAGVEVQTRNVARIVDAVTHEPAIAHQ